MYCSLAATLGWSADVDFSNMCVTTSGSKVTVYVNHAQAMFNISGTATFENIKFTGINAMANPTISTHDLSVFPTQLCSVSTEPLGYDTPLKLNKVSNTGTSPLGYSCSDRWYTAPSTMSKTDFTRRCKINQYE